MGAPLSLTADTGDHSKLAQPEPPKLVKEGHCSSKDERFPSQQTRWSFDGSAYLPAGVSQGGPLSLERQTFQAGISLRNDSPPFTLSDGLSSFLQAARAGSLVVSVILVFTGHSGISCAIGAINAIFAWRG